MYKQLLKNQPLKRIILFQYPGQAFTCFREDVVYSNVVISQIFDGLMYHLEVNKFINIHQNKIKFVGYGFGGNILLQYLSDYGQLPYNFRHVLLVNTFASVDQNLSQFFNEYLDQLDDKGVSDPEYPFYFFNYISSGIDATKSDRKYFQSNPISILGRKSLINGLLSCINIEQRIQQTYLPMYVVQSLTNCLVDVTHCDKLMKVNRDLNRAEQISDANLKRKAIYIQKGHNVILVNLLHTL